MTSFAMPMGPRVLAVDLALKKTGLAAITPEMAKPLVWTFNANRLIGDEREDAIVTELHQAVQLVKPQVILLEDLYAPQRISTGWIAMAFMHGVARRELRKQAPLVIVHNAHIKIYGTGHGDADKSAMVLCTERRYGHLVEVSDDNEADAFTLLALGSHAYGHPLVSDRKLPDTHLRALTMVTWPVIAGLESPAGPTATTRGSGRVKAVKS